MKIWLIPEQFKQINWQAAIGQRWTKVGRRGEGEPAGVFAYEPPHYLQMGSNHSSLPFFFFFFSQYVINLVRLRNIVVNINRVIFWHINVYIQSAGCGSGLINSISWRNAAANESPHLGTAHNWSLQLALHSIVSWQHFRAPELVRVHMVIKKATPPPHPLFFPVS